ncbi:hypothetical protein ACFOOM_13570 [Streptomyces echinoruber]|uniref:Uncharacterized protein n=1 Tax=Streptomyces echinoruber TaxID=68898 RepID=A0A918RFH7_9ACTN|nr:hypothetical protein [Streptomyces echinoruber]GGZ95495.1 hypothetical protein GCM10010389_38260 [Streptomyces echinoruber]
MSEQPLQPEAPAEPPPMRTLGEVRAALAAGLGFPGDLARLEAELAATLDRVDYTDLHEVSELIAAYRGHVLTRCDPDFDASLAEGVELARSLKRENGR